MHVHVHANVLELFGSAKNLSLYVALSYEHTRHPKVDEEEDLQWVAGIKKTGFRGTPPFLSLSTALTVASPTPRRGFLAPAGTQARAGPKKFIGKRSCSPRGRCQSLPPTATRRVGSLDDGKTHTRHYPLALHSEHRRLGLGK